MRKNLLHFCKEHAILLQIHDKLRAGATLDSIDSRKLNEDAKQRAQRNTPQTSSSYSPQAYIPSTIVMPMHLPRYHQSLLKCPSSSNQRRLKCWRSITADHPPTNAYGRNSPAGRETKQACQERHAKSRLKQDYASHFSRIVSCVCRVWRPARVLTTRSSRKVLCALQAHCPIEQKAEAMTWGRRVGIGKTYGKCDFCACYMGGTALGTCLRMHTPCR